MPLRFDPLFKIAFTASLFEWYGFSLTIFMALEIRKIFFPTTDDKSALLLSFSVFASSYLARPLGSIAFGILGNKYGASTALRVSMIGMTAPASLIAFLPTYQTAGYLATGGFISLKILQGFSAGGEMPLSGYFVSLNAADKHRGIYSSVVVASGFLGMLLASGAVLALPYCAKTLSWLLNEPADHYQREFWRLPFLLCIPLSLWIYSLRSSFAIGQKYSTAQTVSSKPIAPLIQSLVLTAFMEAVIYAVFIWLPNYLQSYLAVSSFDARMTNVITLGIFSLSLLGAGYVARWLDASHLVLAGIVSLTFSSYPLFLALTHGGFLPLLLAQAAFAVMTGCLVGVIFVVLSDLFRENWQCLGMTSTYSIATAIFGGTAPIVSSQLIEMTQLLTAPALYITALGFLAFPVAYRICLSRQRSLVPASPNRTLDSRLDRPF
jgi:MHS family proline/betaine transporter-like MFS transporter